MPPTDSTPSRNSFPFFLLRAAVCSFVVATIVPAFAIVLLAKLGSHTFPNPLSLLATVFLLCPITSVSCGLFGMAAGIVGGSLLHLRRKRIRSVQRLLGGSAVVGVVFGLLYIPVDAAVNAASLTSFRPSIGARDVILTLPIAIACALTCALCFRKRFVQ